jgi:uncharacterized phage-associated protein
MASTKNKKDTRLSPKLEAVLAQLCEKLGPLTTTKACKLPYLVDVVAAYVLGRPITDGSHQTWELGVVTREVWSYIQQDSDVNGPFTIKPHPFSEGGFQISLAQNTEPDEPLLAEEKAIVDHVANLYGRLDADSLGKLTKRINTEFDRQAWGRNHKAAVNEDAYARLAEGWQAFADKLPVLDFGDESKWGSPIDDPEEYFRRELLGG